ncbi:hypothetical protein KUTeg_024211 [Tegillarca granosa]|uniref:G-protein coupled receptors family 1 profile domain-containing protein n=1 Tax=Tegillarca granosa TaxID=220873 RepID=A0ABQ9DXQ8_TEGGR|nr:hypothetical protein KUTeg_024211 [Tegillarca granosa]
MSTAEERTLPEATNSKHLSWVGVHVYVDNGTEDIFEISGRDDNMSVINVTSTLLQTNSGIYKTLQQLNDEDAMARLPTIVYLSVLMLLTGFRKINSPLGVQLSFSAAKLSCGIAFCLAIVFSWPNAFIYGQKIKRFEGNVTGYACSTDDDIRKSDYPFIYTVLLLGVFLIIFIVLSSVYALIVYKIKMSTKFNREYLERINKGSKLKVISTFKKGLVAPPSPLVLGLFPIMSKSFFITSAVNPFIYAIGDRRFRKNLRSIVRSKLRCLKLCHCFELDHLHSSGMEMFSSQFRLRSSVLMFITEQEKENQFPENQTDKTDIKIRFRYSPNHYAHTNVHFKINIFGIT